MLAAYIIEMLSVAVWATVCKYLISLVEAIPPCPPNLAKNSIIELYESKNLRSSIQ